MCPGVEEFSKLNDSIYFRDESGVYVNLFIPSELYWREKGLRIRQVTTFPDAPATALEFNAPQPVEMASKNTNARLGDFRHGGENQWPPISDPRD